MAKSPILLGGNYNWITTFDVKIKTSGTPMTVWQKKISFLAWKKNPWTLRLKIWKYNGIKCFDFGKYELKCSINF